MGLKEYQQKRDFSKTTEPPPQGPKKDWSAAKTALFVIQKHAASRLHYDFRLEMEGGLKSWAVPKGIPFEKGDKRLAIQVEDHPLDYAHFEGIIPKGEYGGGTVMVWDTGEYSVGGDSPLQALKEGKLHLLLRGKKLKGEWTLVRTHYSHEADSKEKWLLMKTGDSMRALSKRRDDESALSGRTMKEISAAQDATWNSNREPENGGSDLKTRIARIAVSKTTRAPAEFVQPMKPKLVKAVPAQGEWAFEVKFDGYRVIAVKNGRKVSLYSRNVKPLRVPEISEAIEALPCRSAVLDGEIVALDENGRPSFQLLQAREMGDPVGGEAALICCYLFDLIHVDGKDLRDLPLTERREQLAALLNGVGDPLRYSTNLPGDAAMVLEKVKAAGLEGMVAKRMDSRYEPGLRTGAWLKLKCLNEQEFVIGGYTEPQGSRSHFGSVLVGYFENQKLRFAGKVGTGFNERLLESLFRRFQGLRISGCPFTDLPSKSAGRWNQGITPAQMKRCTWLRPEVVCQVKFSEWTRDGKLRQPVFLGIREDRSAREVVREM